MTDLARVHLDYRAAFLRCLPRREEAALDVGYKLGRAAVSDGLSILDLVQVHHAVLVEVLEDTKGEDVGRVASAASEFFLEVLATYDIDAARPTARIMTLHGARPRCEGASLSA